MRNNPDLPGLGPGLVAELVCESTLGERPASTIEEQACPGLEA